MRSLPLADRGTLDNRVRAFERGHAGALLFLALVALASFFVARQMAEGQRHAAEVAEVFSKQDVILGEIAHSVGYIMWSADVGSLDDRLQDLMAAKLAELTETLRQTQRDVEELSGNQSIFLDTFLSSDEALRKETELADERLTELQQNLRRLTESDPDLLVWEFSVWAPVGLLLSYDGSLRRRVNRASEAALRRSVQISTLLVRVHFAMLLFTITALVAEILFVFWPLLRNLLTEHERVFNLNDQLRHSLMHDALTGLGNVRNFRHRLEERTDAANRVKIALMFADIDDFKSVNESYGRAAGDFVLQTVGDRLGAFCKGDVSACRLGGDEFVIMVGGAPSSADVRELAVGVRREIERTIRYQGHDLSLGASVGCALAQNESGEDADLLLKRADLALRQAKRRKPSSIQIHDGSWDAGAYRTTRLAENFSHHLERGEVVAYYQPVVELGSRKIVGLEALARWNSPDWGLVPPGAFLNALGDRGELRRLTEHMIGCVVKDRATLLEGGIDLQFFSLNLPEAALTDRLMFERFVGIVGSAELPWLQLEIREGVLAHRAWAVIGANLRRFIAAGSTIALDDFGTGNASLTDLHKVSCGMMKMDRSFIREVPANRSATSIVEGLIKMAEGVPMTVVAEGVERAEQAIQLRELGARYGQGFLFGRPQTIEDISRTGITDTALGDTPLRFEVTVAAEIHQASRN